MKKEPVIVLTEDDDGHSGLILYNLKEAGITNEIVQLQSGEETLNFFFRRGNGTQMKEGVQYVLLLDVRLPGIDGIEVLRQLKDDKWTNQLPVIMISCMDNPKEIEKCRKLGCSNYFVKNLVFEKFSQTMEQVGQYINEVILPDIENQ